MKEINLQDLLLESLEKKQEKSYQKRIYTGGRCFVLKFRLTGNILIFDDIKTREPRKRHPAIERFHKRRRNLRRRSHLIYRSLKPDSSTMEKSSSCSILSVEEKMNTFSQTEKKEHKDRGTFTSKLVKRILKKSRDTQTKQTYSERDFKLTQTKEIATTSIGIEASSLMVPCGVETERNELQASSQTQPLSCKDISTQYEGSNFNITTQTVGDSEEYNKLTVQEQTVVYLLNEIGEISVNNRDLAEKSIDVTMNVFELLRKIVNAQKLQLSILQPLTKWDPMLGLTKTLLSESTQTEDLQQYKKDKQTQTNRKKSCWKRRL